MKRVIFFFEDDSVENFYPLSLSHSPAEFLCGILSLGDKWTARLEHDEFRLISREYLSGYLGANLHRKINDFAAGGVEEALFINPRFVAADDIAEQIETAETATAWWTNDQLIALRLGADSGILGKLSSLSDSRERYQAIVQMARGVAAQTAKLREFRYLWDLVHENSNEIERDFELLLPELNFGESYQDAEVDEDCLIYNVDDVFIGRNARIDGQVVIDARSGPIYIGENVIIAPHTRVEGPCYVGDFSQLVGGKVRTGCSFGPYCRIGGEVEESVFLGYSNKYHEGFIGHAYVGEWVNFGALTTNSDLKNNYGEIKVEFPSGLINTGLNKIGCLIGDHTKTGIGTLITTGMTVGFSANLFGGGLAGGRFLPSFMWGGKDGFVDYQVEKAIETAKVVMKRRDKEFSPAADELFKSLFAQTMPQRASWKPQG